MTYNMYCPISFTFNIYSIVLTTFNHIESSGAWAYLQDSPDPLSRVTIGRGNDTIKPNYENDISTIIISI